MGLTSGQIQEASDRICAILMSHAAHGLATSSLKGMGEITLRDGLIVAAAATGASLKQAWILKREKTPSGWTDAAVDLTIYRVGNQGAKKEIAGVELKWWHQEDKGNASNRRRDLVKDFLRTAALNSCVEEFSLMALLSTEISWTSTVNTNGSDACVAKLMRSTANEKWNVSNIISSAAVKGAIRYLNGKVPITNVFHTKLLSALDLSFASGKSASARVWLVKKPQNSHYLTAPEVAKLLGTSS